VARLRFSIHGQVLELAGPETPPSNPEDVLTRDSISRAAGAVPEGYTLPDIGVLVRSRHAPQRAVGFRMLAAVLRRARPSVGQIGLEGQLLPQHVLLDVSPEQQQQGQQGQQQQQQCVGTGVLWSDVWQYAVVALRAVMLCRLALDEDNAQVGHVGQGYHSMMPHTYAKPQSLEPQLWGGVNVLLMCVWVLGSSRTAS